jgi:hypothetical protein
MRRKFEHHQRPLLPPHEFAVRQLRYFGFSLLILAFVGVLFAPVYHRFLHRFHLDIGDGREKG